MKFTRIPRENNICEMKILLDQAAGVNIGQRLRGFLCVAEIGKNGQMVLEVKFMNT